mgnify:CR=1 FL=1
MITNHEAMGRQTVTIGPFSWFFTNRNTDMGLPGHSHFATVTLEYTNVGDRGFPAFEDTYATVQRYLLQLGEHPFRDATNEEVARQLFVAFLGWTAPAIARWGGTFTLSAVALAVRGVPDRIGHADGFTVYTVHAKEIV